MPVTIQWYVRTALLYILASAVLGVLYQLDLWLHPFGFHPYVITVHVHLALMGGVIQMIMGVALWMFPLTTPMEERLHFRLLPAWTAFGLFNVGLLGRFFVEYRYRLEGGDLYGGLTFFTGVLQIAALVVFIAHLWSLRRAKRKPQ